MAFLGEFFTFDNISSERYNLRITTPDSKSTINISDYQSNVIKTKRQSKFYPLKQTIEKPLEIPVSIFSETPLSRNQLDQIDSWLFRNDGKFRKLRIHQKDMEGYYYNCRLIKLEAETFGNNIYVINVIMQMDSIYAWQNIQTRSIVVATTPHEFKFVNISSEEIMKPIYTLKCSADNGTIKITDTTTNSIMEFNNLLLNEVLTIDTEHEIITSDKRTSGLLDLFTNINFMRLSKGTHNFKLEGNISEFKITYEVARKIGG